MEPKKDVSPSRTYVAICNKTNFNGYYCREFVLPADQDNTMEFASWYFLNRLNFVACLNMCMTKEDYLDICVQKTQFS